MRRRRIFATCSSFLIAGLTATALLLPDASPVAGPMASALAFVTPAFCTALLLTGLDPAARAILSGTAAIALNVAVAEVMLAGSIWSPRGGLMAVAAGCIPLFALAVVRRRNNRDSGEMRMAGPTGPDDDDESWAFDR
ncbi:hypothetical protein GCM10023196_084030 [Actinoallomurus vinaceus]|uniref:Integral membrane protein n=2 Tax=Actinoallomurus vinaceus TaxID=1080074 RepID=A0ABP8UR38_9ACTN